MKLSKEEKLAIFENAISWIVVFAMYVYGFAKMIQFGGATQIDKPVSELTGMQLMWAFYGYSKPFALVLGFFEVLGGTLILIKRTRLIGCFFTSTILVNVILQDIFYGVNQGALRAAIIYQFLILVILWLNRTQVFESVIRLLLPKNKIQFKSKILLHLFLAFILFVILRIAEYYVSAY